MVFRVDQIPIADPEMVQSLNELYWLLKIATILSSLITPIRFWRYKKWGRKASVIRNEIEDSVSLIVTYNKTLSQFEMDVGGDVYKVFEKCKKDQAKVGGSVTLEISELPELGR